MNFYQALKANETSKVYSIDRSIYVLEKHKTWEVGELIDAVNQGKVSTSLQTSLEWKVYEGPNEYWAVKTPNGAIALFKYLDKNHAITHAKERGSKEILLLREVEEGRQQVNLEEDWRGL
jgi:hypothetical protein